MKSVLDKILKEGNTISESKVLSYLPDDINNEQVSEIITLLEDMEVEVTDKEDRPEALAKTKVSEEELVSIKDPLFSYYRDISKTKTISKKEEVELANSFREGTRQVCLALSKNPVTFRLLDGWFAQVDSDQITVDKIVDVRKTYLRETGEKGSSVISMGVEMLPVIKNRIETIKSLKDNYEALSHEILNLDLTEERLEQLMSEVSLVSDTLLQIDSKLVKLADRCKVNRKEFILSYKGNETNLDWTNSFPQNKHWQAFKQHEDYIRSIQQDLSHIEEYLGCSIQLFREIVSDLEKGKKQREEAFHALICANLRLVVFICKKYFPQDGVTSDKIQLGNLGLITAVKKFDPSLGYKFSTYATYWIRAAISKGLRNSRTITMSQEAQQTVSRIKQIQDYYTKKHNRNPRPEEIAKKLKISTDKVQQLLEISQPTVSTDLIIGEDGSTTTLGEILEDTHAQDPLTAFLQSTTSSSLQEVLKNTLSERDMLILNMRFGLSDFVREHTLQEVGDTLNISKQRVAQLQSKAILKIKEQAKQIALKADIINAENK